MSDTEESEKPLDPMSARPLYVQPADIIEREIASGELAPDRPIPSENHLADEYGVARLTARRATQELRERGLAVTVRGEGLLRRRAATRSGCDRRRRAHRRVICRATGA